MRRSVIVGLAGALGLALMLPPVSGATQESPEPQMITVTGTAVNPDGTPGANLAVAVKVPDKQPAKGAGAGSNAPGALLGVVGSQGQRPMKVLAKGTTDSEGKFSLKFQPPQVGSAILEIGESSKTPWIRQTLAVQGKDLDLGRIQLRAIVPPR